MARVEEYTELSEADPRNALLAEDASPSSEAVEEFANSSVGWEDLCSDWYARIGLTGGISPSDVIEITVWIIFLAMFFIFMKYLHQYVQLWYNNRDVLRKRRLNPGLRRGRT